jgi:hypothetical protein
MKNPFPPRNAPDDTMGAFLTLIRSLCETSESIWSTGVVSFLQFRDFFFSNTEATENQQMKETPRNSVETLQMAATQGHIGIIKDILKSQPTELT